MKLQTEPLNKTEITTELVLQDYHTVVLSRQLSLLGRKEVLTGRATFGIFGDGKEVAQVAMARNFRKGDWRSGYYRDQTFMLAAGLLTVDDFFVQLYGMIDETRYPNCTGRNFNNHFATPNVDPGGNRLPVSQSRNSASDISPTSGQMPRLYGLAYASKLFRSNASLNGMTDLSDHGNEVAFGMIGESGTSEGVFWEVINAAGVAQVPMAVAVWDDGYGISVPVEEQTVKASISEALRGLMKKQHTNGIMIYACKGWDYPSLVEMFVTGLSVCRDDHVPVVFHIQELTQPLGHSTSGSHNRYKTEERLEWEKAHDPIERMKEWILREHLSDRHSLEQIENAAKKEALEARERIWKQYTAPALAKKEELIDLLAAGNGMAEDIASLGIYGDFMDNRFPKHNEVIRFAKTILNQYGRQNNRLANVIEWLKNYQEAISRSYNSHLHVEQSYAASTIRGIKPEYGDMPRMVPGREVLNRNFEVLFKKHPLLVTFGEDTGQIGDVDQGMKGLQEKFGNLRVSDAGIREATIVGQGIGMALRGFKPIAEIQYLDYLVYALHAITDDLASTHYRTAGRQIVPMIIRTRGHRLVGIWHSGSPIGMIINSARGVHLCVPRNLTQAAGFYNTLMESNDPAIVIEPLKGYSLREALPDNLGEFRIPLGEPEILTEGSDITLVTYGWCVNPAIEAVNELRESGISVELIDVQTLLPFDTQHMIRKSIDKTNHVLFLDEDVPGGATAFMMQKAIEEQGAFYSLDTPPRTLTAKEHRPAYGADGDFFSKPGKEDIMDVIYDMMQE